MHIKYQAPFQYQEIGTGIVLTNECLYWHIHIFINTHIHEYMCSSLLLINTKGQYVEMISNWPFPISLLSFNTPWIFQCLATLSNPAWIAFQSQENTMLWSWEYTLLYFPLYRSQSATLVVKLILFAPACPKCGGQCQRITASLTLKTKNYKNWIALSQYKQL